ncbi:SapC family protein [Novosphingobium malaysiense]|uniref:Multidrug transporter n=1 Tax=Novosphingobium malaysiense TaxID=1348853 RepID=A0A0B1ZWM3_9SPHN|nr:SapC family protein [Novosphingobium malaysiense]KHK93578.1 hypothetical protein LK12_04885 [Novosphingobium malaysiense]
MSGQQAKPLFYSKIEPLESNRHKNWTCRKSDRISWLSRQNVIPLTVDEFRIVQHQYPIVFSADRDPVPLALMGLRPGCNDFVDVEGNVLADTYVPAYARRYPFILSKIHVGNELALCVDPTSDLVGEAAGGAPLFAEGAPTQVCRDALSFCEEFERAGARTREFVAELVKSDLLVAGRTTVRGTDSQMQTFTGFQIVDETKLKQLKPFTLGKWATRGLLQHIYSHIFSLDLMTKVTGRRVLDTKRPS